MRLAGFGSNPEHQSEYVHEAGIERELKGREGTTLTSLGFSLLQLHTTWKSDRLLGTAQRVGQPLRKAHFNKVPRS